MAIYHLEAKVVSRGTGRSAVAASAYLSCTNILNDYDGVRHDYTRKKGLIWREVFLPEYAPPEWKDREQLWNAVEAAEKTKDSRLAREFVVALPIELDKDSNISLLQNFIQKNFVNMGMCADFAIHDTDGHNPHAHILLTVRPLNENGTWQYKTEKEYLLALKDLVELNLKSLDRVRYIIKRNVEKGLLKNFKTSYSGEFKQSVVEYMHTNHLSSFETAIHFNLAGDYVVSKWERIYYEEGPQGLYIERRGRSKNMSSKPRKKNLNKEVEEDLIAENQRLRMENEYLKKLNALVQERIKRENKKK